MCNYHDNIIVVTMDEESDDYLGETYPYSYASQSRFLKRMISENPLSLNYIGRFRESRDDMDKAPVIEFSHLLKRIIDNNVAVFLEQTIGDWGVQSLPEELRNNKNGLAIINTDKGTFAEDDVARRLILNISGENSFHLMSANYFRVANGKKRLEINDIHGAYYFPEADATFARFRYATNPHISSEKIKTIPFHRAMVGNYPKDFFNEKIVLLGPSYISNRSHFLFTPFDKKTTKSSRMFLHAVIIESLIQNKTVEIFSKYFSYFLSILLGGFLSFVISRMKPSKGLALTVAVMFGVILIVYLLFILFGIYINLAHIILSIFVVYYIWVPFRAMAEYQRRFAIQKESALIKKVDGLKQNFISLMSHDLKTPVAKIAGLVDNLMQQNRENDQLILKLNAISGATRELNGFITSILDLAKIESRNMGPNMVSKDVNLVVETVVNNYKYEASQKNISLNIDLSPLYPIQFDVNLMNRVISNLVENAIKYSDQDCHVEIKTWDDDQWVYIEVKDNGPGIGEDDLENIFEKFYRVKNNKTHSIKGSGLGLYLVKYFIELHGGSIEAFCGEDKGTAFLVKLKNE